MWKHTVAGIGLLCLSGVVASGQTFQVLHTFSHPGSPFPFGRMLATSNVLFGINGGFIGGTPDSGSIFRVNNDGSGYAALKRFQALYPGPGGVYTNTEGSSPLGGLVAGGAMLYGTAQAGGKFGMGTVFSIRADGSNFTALKHFSGSDGKNPYAELVLDGDMLYGTTAAGGVSNKGTVFRIGTDALNFSVLKSFDGANGLLPLSGLTLSEGVLYGTTYKGGAANLGTVFSLGTNGSGFTTLKEFTGSDGGYPRFNLIVADGTIYGTTEGSGVTPTNSLVYRLNTDGSGFAVLKTFSTPDPVTGTNDDGSGVRTGLAAAGGTLFGATRGGGHFANGTIFALRMDGSAQTILHHFSAGDGETGENEDGATPFPSLTRAGGVLYGTTENGGTNSAGTLFSVNISPEISALLATNGFSFSVSGYSNQIVVIEASSNVEAGSWLPLATNVIGAGPISFSDPNRSNFPRRFYRVRMQ